jgi:hypothetical protein
MARNPHTVDADARREYGDPPREDDPVACLRHTLRVFKDTADDREVLMATSNVYIDEPWTGLTFGDLRAILRKLDGENG